jgi:malate dehydrogenase (oxaloacetate-decarboxylating)
MDYNENALKLHRENRGKIETGLKVPLENRDDLSVAYTPGVAAVCRALHADASQARELTIKRNTIAVVTDGSAVLGLGNIGALAGLPVMEGKAALFKRFANVDAFPICLDTQDTEEIVKAVKQIAPVFGGINLEDIAAPKCFEIEKRLKAELDIPVMHDDQHGTAVVVLAALINALKIRGLDKAFAKIVINGAGAAGMAIADLLLQYGFVNLILVDSNGIISNERTDLNSEKLAFLDKLNGTLSLRGVLDDLSDVALLARHSFSDGGAKLEVIPDHIDDSKGLPRSQSLPRNDGIGGLSDTIKGAHVFVGVSKAGLLTSDMVRAMAERPIICALANPIPEILPDEAKAAGAYIIATGRSDFPNQINNVLAFPGIFRGALDNSVTQITDAMLTKAAEALASLVDAPAVDYILPSPFDASIVPAVASAIR